MSGNAAPTTGSAGAASAMRFYLVFDIKDQSGNAVKELKADLKLVGEAGKEAGEKVEELGHKVHSVVDMAQEVHHLSDEMQHLGHTIMGVVEGLTERTVHAAAEFDTLRAQIGFAFGPEQERAWNNINQFASTSVYRVSQITESVAALRSAFRHVDPTDLTARFRSSTGEMINSLTALSDASAGAQVTLGESIQMVERAMEGNYQSIAYQMRLSSQETERMRQGIARARTEQEKYDAIIQVIAQHWGGAQSAMSNTFNFIKLQLTDLAELLGAGFGAAALEPLKEAVTELGAFMRHLLHDREFMAAIASGFRVIGEAGRRVVRVVIHVGEALHALVKANPGIVRMAATVATLAGVLLVLGGKILAFLAVVTASTWIVTTMGAALVAAFKAALIGLALFTAGFAVLYVAFRVMRALWERDFAGIPTALRRAKLLVEALAEAFQHWGEDGAEISVELAHRLKQAGILQFYNHLVGWIERARRFAVGMIRAFQYAWAQTRPDVEAGVAELSGAFRHLFKSIKDVLVEIGVIRPATSVSLEGAQTAGASWARQLTEIIIPLIRAVVFTIRMIAWVIRHLVAPAVVSMIALVVWGYRVWQEHSVSITFALQVILAALGLIAVAVGLIVAAVLALAVAVGTTLLLTVLTLASPFLAVYLLVKKIKDTIAGWFGHGETAREADSVVGRLAASRSLPEAIGAIGGSRTNAATSSGTDGVVGQGRSREEQVVVRALTRGTMDMAALRGEKEQGSRERDEQKSATMRRSLEAAMSPTNDTLQQLLAAQTEMNAAMRSGAFRTVLTDSALAAAVGRANTRTAERGGQIPQGGGP